MSVFTWVNRGQSLQDRASREKGRKSILSLLQGQEISAVTRMCSRRPPQFHTSRHRHRARHMPVTGMPRPWAVRTDSHQRRFGDAVVDLDEIYS